MENVPAEADSPDERALARYFETRDGKPSARIYRNLGSDPVMAEIIRRKQPTYRELLMMVSAIVAALDERVEELEARERGWDRAGYILNLPIFAKGSPPTDGATDGGADPVPDASEPAWILKYVTLRNVLAVLLVVVTSGAGFFAWWNADYRSLLAGSKQRVESLTKEADQLRFDVSRAEQRERDKDAELTRMRQRAEAAEQKQEALQKRLDDQQKERETKAETAQDKMAAELEQLRTRVASMESDVSTQKKSADEWQGNYKKQEELFRGKVDSFVALQTQQAKTSLERDSAVNAWNDLLEFLGRNRTHGLVSIRIEHVEERLRQLASQYTESVKGMMTTLPES